MDESLKKIYLKRIKTYVTVSLLVIIIGSVSFGYFFVYTEGRKAFKEARNIRLALSMLSVEYYGKGAAIYEPTRQSGLDAGVEERLKEVIESNGRTTVLHYNAAEREVTSFIYETGNYRVFYEKTSKKTQWKVSYNIPIMKYEE